MELAKQFGEPNSLKIVKFYINYNDITHFKNRGIAPQRMKKNVLTVHFPLNVPRCRFLTRRRLLPGPFFCTDWKQPGPNKQSNNQKAFIG